MALNARRLRSLTGVALALATLATRLPFRAKTFFEFDSINFAVATFRFDLREVTPQMPGYILHILPGRLLSWITGDINSGLIWVSLLLSIGAVLFLWRAAAQLRGERVAIIAAIVWLTTPLFWFHGEVAAIYAHEAFFASAMLYAGLKLLRQQDNTFIAYFLLLLLSLAGAARQNDLVFFLPATVYVLWKSRIRGKHLVLASLAFIATTALWLGELLRESGGLATYLEFAKHEINFKTQSVLFGNSWQSQWDLIAKVAFNLPMGMGAAMVMCLLILAVFPGRVVRFVKQYAVNAKALYVVMLPVPALLFYFTIFFMKAGYLLNVVPSAILIVAVLTDQAAIWLAERTKRKPENKLRLTRPIITRNVIVLTSFTAIANCLWFFIPWPGTSQARYNNENTRNSFVHGALNRLSSSRERYATLANRAFEYTNLSGIQAVDNINNETLRVLIANGADDSNQVIIASWWSRWCYLLTPRATTYDIEVDFNHPGALAVGRAREFHRDNLYDSLIPIHTSRPVLLLMRHDRSDFAEVSRQVHLERLPMPEYLDVFKILDSAFVLRWRDRVFVKP